MKVIFQDSFESAHDSLPQELLRLTSQLQHLASNKLQQLFKGLQELQMRISECEQSKVTLMQILRLLDEKVATVSRVVDQFGMRVNYELNILKSKVTQAQIKNEIFVSKQQATQKIELHTSQIMTALTQAQRHFHQDRKSQAKLIELLGNRIQELEQNNRQCLQCRLQRKRELSSNYQKTNKRKPIFQPSFKQQLTLKEDVKVRKQHRIKEMPSPIAKRQKEQSVQEDPLIQFFCEGGHDRFEDLIMSSCSSGQEDEVFYPQQVDQTSPFQMQAK